ncbi:hypothetical protein QT972_16625 [Microcoleus sp. herbarium7]|uniref:hypothetical protein n=1 Tax=Microcoleus sp. herbarium7 TaxID=3055435 RepID=UPI002FD79F19
MTEPLSSFEILKLLAIKDGVYKEGDTKKTMQLKLGKRRQQGQKNKFLVEPRNPPKLTIPSEFRNIVVCALRYAHTATSSDVTSFVIETTIQNWNWLAPNDRLCIRKDTKGAIEDRLSSTTFKEDWLEFDRWLNEPGQDTNHPVKEEVNGLGLLTVYALRYCVGRASYMPGTIVDATKENWHLLNRVDRQQIQNDVQSAIATRHLGHECDRETWMSFNEWMTEQAR